MKKIITIVLLIGCANAFAQNGFPKQEVRQGNLFLKNGKVEEAETAYRKALDKDSTYYKAQYNLGNALYKKKNYAEAAKHYEVASQYPSINKKEASKIEHNLGNSYLQAGLADKENGLQNFQKAVDSYQQALLKDPKNEDTRYNYSYAKKMLKKAQQQQQQGEGDNQNQDQKDKNQQNQQENKNQQNKQNQQQQNQQEQQGQQGKDDPKDQKKKQDQQHQDQKKMDAERLLEAVNNNEKKTMKEHQKQLETGKPVRTEKDW